ncbi:MAG TPA: homoserine O-acetyltransferase [Ktedonobacteraceae bacterium]|nr:homoserine O-acetyltransferase [Ktedonobacteraceae bacterium]
MVAQVDYSKRVHVNTLRSPQMLINQTTSARTYTFDHLPLQRGGHLSPVTLAYETWGTLNAKADNAILITHALTGNAHAHDPFHPDDAKAAWWNPLIGPGRVFDTDRYYVICSNVVGSCYGSTGPSSIDPRTRRPYGMRFPVITIHDMVNAQRRLLDYLGVQQLAMVAGGSIGGQQALQWAVSYPDFVRKVVVVAATAALTAQAIAFNEVERQAIMVDPAWLCGDYAPGHGPTTGLAIARMLAMITYQSEEAMELRFARNSVQRERAPSPTNFPDLGGRFDVENYLYHQGDALAQRFDANSYLYISRAMDFYDVSEGYESIEAALQRITCKALFIGIRSDFLFPAAHVRWLAEKVRALGGDARYTELDSPHGHDAFLKEWQQMAEALSSI